MQHAEEVVHRGARRAGDYGDPHGQEGEPPLAGGVEQAFRLEPRLELFEGDLQRAGAERLDGIADELVLPLRLVEGHPSPDEHREAVLHGEAEPPGLAREQHGADARVGVLEREIEVAARGTAEVRDLAAHVQRREPPLEDALHLAGQLADRVDPRLRNRDRRAGARREEVELARATLGRGGRACRLLGGLRSPGWKAFGHETPIHSIRGRQTERWDQRDPASGGSSSRAAFPSSRSSQRRALSAVSSVPGNAATTSRNACLAASASPSFATYPRR